MTHEEVMELILDHYKNPRHHGEVEGAALVCNGGNQGCGDTISIYVDADPDGVVRRLGFTGEGCMISQAGASIILEKAEGMTLPEIEALSAEILPETLGKRLVLTRQSCAYLGFNTLKLALNGWRSKILENGSPEE